MRVALQIIAMLLFVYWVVLIGRLILDLVQMFARSWEPRGPLLVIAEAVYTVTDPPLKLLRRLIPPVRIGGLSFDLAFLILLIGLQVLISITLNL